FLYCFAGGRSAGRRCESAARLRRGLKIYTIEIDYSFRVKLIVRIVAAVYPVSRSQNVEEIGAGVGASGITVNGIATSTNLGGIQRVAAIVAVVSFYCRNDLANVVFGLRFSRGVQGCVDPAKRQRYQNGNDQNDHDYLNERKRWSIGIMESWSSGVLE